MKSRSFTVILHKEDDLYIVECPEIGTVDQGETIGVAEWEYDLLRNRHIAKLEVVK